MFVLFVALSCRRILFSYFIYETRDVANIVRAVATTGDDPTAFGAHSARIGGATDYRALVGDVVARRVLKVRGRWKSDI